MSGRPSLEASSQPSQDSTQSSSSTPLHSPLASSSHLPLRSAIKFASSTQGLRNPDKSNRERSISPGSDGERTHIPMARVGTGISILPAGYKRSVAFDTMDAAPDSRTGGGTGVSYSFTLQVKSDHYERTKSTREFLVATDLNEYSVNALTWLLGNLIEDGDEVVVLRVMDPTLITGTTAPANADLRELVEEAREEALSVLDDILERNHDRSISIVVEFAIGQIQDTIQRMINIYKPDSLVVGTRGRSESVWRSAFMGSTSRYCLSRSPVPVIVVRPGRKVKKSLEARKMRMSYSSMVAPRPMPATRNSDGPPETGNSPNTIVDNKRASKGWQGWTLAGLSLGDGKSMKRFKTAPS